LTIDQLTATANLYYSCGVTTGHDIFMSMADPTFYKAIGDQMPMEISAYQWIGGGSSVNFLKVMANYSTSKVTPRGAKFILDGSINAYTARLTQPYWVPQAN
jgi:predicted amidohydrolase YtcJ